jgi:hypothetical protein
MPVKTEPAEPTTSTSLKQNIRIPPVEAVAPPTVAPSTVAPSTTAAPAPAAHVRSGKATWLDTIPTGTCANNDAPMGAVITVAAVGSGVTVSCRVVSRGPYGAGVIVDLAEATFAVLAPPSQGVVDVRVSW